ncbi:MAG: (2Fe-2S)-binding protein [Candidatus Krumholzibacteria bacterium]|nr:(2Fe-2S)-binding protein [Candidatus Krumholzibacteria bacterium]
MASDKVHIRFEGKTLECRSDTTVAVALWENGVRCLSRSPKYGRPRGVTCARGHCTACLMRVDNIPNVRTCELPVREGMEIQRQDAGAFYAAPMQKVLAAGSAFFPVGFYYKWFTKPATVSRLFLNGIRPLTGVGRLPGPEHATRVLPPASDPQDPTAASATDLGRFDTVIVGAGPSGLAAAEKATGRVLILDDHEIPGGQRYGALRRLAEDQGKILDRFDVLRSSLERIEKLRDQFSTRNDVTFLQGTRAIAGYHPDHLLLRREDRLQSVKFDTLIWAAGALDTLGLFPGNDTPGLLGPRALYRLLVRDGLQVKGMHVLIIGGGLDFWLSAALLDVAGAHLSLVVTNSDDPSEIPAAVDRKWPLNTGLILDNISGMGEQKLRASFSPDGSQSIRHDSQMTMDADLAVICNRAKPAYDVPFQLGGDVTLQPDLGGFALSDDSSLVAVGEAGGNLPGDPAHPADEVNIP